ncbi:PEP-CTERM sorting domain-containing protein [Noviherbaspirillum galbum]|uniref:PEP-CTERM sorting domain-containing protein n=1 Tax=Noviherbaspirillum galbum TaxID=2709383 RepID=A0A6B3SVM2_9BURK|nr:PEP-CTERM sorting domain-containing protein [Noviherbaspirillum galbum]NEX64578.1 PEP-CTERM sorting domain-containing protein [Noviherbaspirillum galbum]
MKTRLARYFAPLFFLAAGFSNAASAATVSFDFNSITLSGNYSSGLGAVGSTNAIASYMNGVLAAGGYAGATVNVTGALATKTYDGEGHVSGATLGTSDNNVSHAAPNDTFIINNSFGIGASAADQFTLTFNNFLVQSVSFDWEIFPNASCAAGSGCANSKNVNNANWPDMSLLAGAGMTQIWYQDASIPANRYIDPQGIGMSGSLTIPNGGTNMLTFRDWPATIGVDNLIINGCLAMNGRCNNVPEPSPILLIGLVAFAYGTRRLVKRR